MRVSLEIELTSTVVCGRSDFSALTDYGTKKYLVFSFVSVLSCASRGGLLLKRTKYFTKFEHVKYVVCTHFRDPGQSALYAIEQIIYLLVDSLNTKNTEQLETPDKEARSESFGVSLVCRPTLE